MQCPTGCICHDDIHGEQEIKSREFIDATRTLLQGWLREIPPREKAIREDADTFKDNLKRSEAMKEDLCVTAQIEQLRRPYGGTEEGRKAEKQIREIEKKEVVWRKLVWHLYLAGEQLKSVRVALENGLAM